MNKRAILTTCLAMLAASGCASYYKVTDPTTGKEYYTSDLDRKKNGAATLKDARTGNTVNLQNSEIAKITKEQYEMGRHTPPPAPPKAPEPSPFR